MGTCRRNAAGKLSQESRVRAILKACREIVANYQDLAADNGRTKSQRASDMAWGRVAAAERIIDFIEWKSKEGT